MVFTTGPSAASLSTEHRNPSRCVFSRRPVALPVVPPLESRHHFLTCHQRRENLAALLLQGSLSCLRHPVCSEVAFVISVPWICSRSKNDEYKPELPFPPHQPKPRHSPPHVKNAMVSFLEAHERTFRGAPSSALLSDPCTIMCTIICTIMLQSSAKQEKLALRSSSLEPFNCRGPSAPCDIWMFAITLSRSTKTRTLSPCSFHKPLEASSSELFKTAHHIVRVQHKHQDDHQHCQCIVLRGTHQQREVTTPSNSNLEEHLRYHPSPAQHNQEAQLHTSKLPVAHHMRTDLHVFRQLPAHQAPVWPCLLAARPLVHLTENTSIHHLPINVVHLVQNKTIPL